MIAVPGQDLLWAWGRRRRWWRWSARRRLFRRIVVVPLVHKRPGDECDTDNYDEDRPGIFKCIEIVEPPKYPDPE